MGAYQGLYGHHYSQSFLTEPVAQMRILSVPWGYCGACDLLTFCKVGKGGPPGTWQVFFSTPALSVLESQQASEYGSGLAVVKLESGVRGKTMTYLKVRRNEATSTVQFAQ